MDEMTRLGCLFLNNPENYIPFKFFLIELK